jgi:hypothetical protein
MEDAVIDDLIYSLSPATIRVLYVGMVALAGTYCAALVISAAYLLYRHYFPKADGDTGVVLEVKQ